MLTFILNCCNVLCNMGQDLFEGVWKLCDQMYLLLGRSSSWHSGLEMKLEPVVKDDWVTCGRDGTKNVDGFPKNLGSLIYAQQIIKTKFDLLLMSLVSCYLTSKLCNLFRKAATTYPMSRSIETCHTIKKWTTWVNIFKTCNRRKQHKNSWKTTVQNMNCTKA